MTPVSFTDATISAISAGSKYLRGLWRTTIAFRGKVGCLSDGIASASAVLAGDCCSRTVCCCMCRSPGREPALSGEVPDGLNRKNEGRKVPALGRCVRDAGDLQKISSLKSRFEAKALEVTTSFDLGAASQSHIGRFSPGFASI